MSRYKRKYLSKKIKETPSNKVYRYSKAFSTIEESQRIDDTVSFDSLTKWGLANKPFSIYNFESADPYSDKARRNLDIQVGSNVSVEKTKTSGLLGYINFKNSLDPNSAGRISKFVFGRNQDRTIIFVSQVQVPGNYYLGGPGAFDSKDAFFHAAYNASRGRAVISYGPNPTKPDQSHQNWLTTADSGKLCITMVRWKQSVKLKKATFSVKYKVINQKPQGSSLDFGRGSFSNTENFYLGDVAGTGISTADTRIYWLGFFNYALDDTDFDAAAQIVGI